MRREIPELEKESRAGEQCESVRVNASKCTWGNSRVRLGKFIRYMREFFIQVELRLSVIIGVMHSHFEYVYMHCEPTE